MGNTDRPRWSLRAWAASLLKRGAPSDAPGTGQPSPQGATSLRARGTTSLRARGTTSLRARGTTWVLVALISGVAATWLFLHSQSAWRAHLDRAYIAGLALFDSLETGAPPPEGLSLRPLTGAPTLPHGWRETRLTLGDGRPGPAAPGSAPRLSLRIQSPRIAYPVAQMRWQGGGARAAGLASVTRAMASLCGDPVLIVRLGASGPWQRAEAPALWSCAAAPPDRRLWAIALAGAATLLLLGSVTATAQSFTGFARALRAHRSQQPDLPEGGPDELRQTAAAVNAFLSRDRDALANRAMLLSGISHDLGTPATRLRLRAARIADPDLRARFTQDIDEMTGMIDSVLSYTRAELGTEPFSRLSFRALIEAVVEDYRDVGLAVTLKPLPQPIARAGSVFARGGPHSPADPSPLLMRGQPMALRRALNNLIDNALKYGRRAEIALTADADTLRISVTDRGAHLSPEDLSRLTAAFTRGANAGQAPGMGLGLALVSTIAGQHGGGLEFDNAEGGLTVRLTLQRSWA